MDLIRAVMRGDQSINQVNDIIWEANHIKEQSSYFRKGNFASDSVPEGMFGRDLPMADSSKVKPFLEKRP